MAEAQGARRCRVKLQREFWISFVIAFVICFFGVTIGWDTILADLIVLGVTLLIGFGIGTTIRRARERRNT